MLESLDRNRRSCYVHRLANLTHIGRFAAKKGLSIEAIVEVIRHSPDETARSLLTDPFKRKPKLDNRYGTRTRFSDGSWPVFYSALEEETAKAEGLYHYARKAAGDSEARRAVNYSIMRCKFEGDVIDLIPQHNDWPGLTSEELDFCVALGREAHLMGLGAFLAPSARHPEGTTVPAFSADNLTEPVAVNAVRFAFDTESLQTNVEIQTVE